VEKSIVPKLRAGVASALALPFGLAAFAAALTSGEPPVEVMGPVLGVVVCVLGVCWLRLALHRHRPQGPDDDDQPWRRDSSGDDPRPPEGGTDGPVIDWPAFERDFAAYVRARERSSERVLIPAG